MKRAFKNQRLIQLYESNGLIREDGSIGFMDVANQMENLGLRMNQPSVGMDYAANSKNIYTKRKNTADTLRKHLDLESPSNLSGNWITVYCHFFGCSAEYLLGLIDEPIHEYKDIYTETGLSFGVVQTLKSIQLHDTNNGQEPDYMPILNRFLESRNGKFTHDLLHRLDILMNLNGTLALHKDGSDIIPDGPHGLRLIHPDGTSYTAIDTKDLIKANTYDQIKQTISDFVSQQTGQGFK